MDITQLDQVKLFMYAYVYIISCIQYIANTVSYLLTNTEMKLIARMYASVPGKHT